MEICTPNKKGIFKKEKSRGRKGGKKRNKWGARNVKIKARKILKNIKNNGGERGGRERRGKGAESEEKEREKREKNGNKSRVWRARGASARRSRSAAAGGARRGRAPLSPSPQKPPKRTFWCRFHPKIPSGNNRDLEPGGVGVFFWGGARPEPPPGGIWGGGIPELTPNGEKNPKFGGFWGRSGRQRGGRGGRAGFGTRGCPDRTDLGFLNRFSPPPKSAHQPLINAASWGGRGGEIGIFKIIFFPLLTFIFPPFFFFTRWDGLKKKKIPPKKREYEGGSGGLLEIFRVFLREQRKKDLSIFPALVSHF